MTPRDVRAALRGEVGDDQLARLLATLRADPAWRVLEPFAHPPEWIFQMVYEPTGHPLGFAGRKASPTTWRFRDTTWLANGTDVV